MHDAIVVKVGQPNQDLEYDKGCLSQGEVLVVQQVLKGSLCQLHDDARVPVLLILINIKYSDQVSVPQVLQNGVAMALRSAMHFLTK